MATSHPSTRNRAVAKNVHADLIMVISFAPTSHGIETLEHEGKHIANRQQNNCRTDYMHHVSLRKHGKKTNRCFMDIFCAISECYSLNKFDLKYIA